MVNWFRQCSHVCDVIESPVALLCRRSVVPQELERHLLERAASHELHGFLASVDSAAAGASAALDRETFASQAHRRLLEAAVRRQRASPFSTPAFDSNAVPATKHFSPIIGRVLLWQNFSTV
eukprot:SAG11_NODE_446_length_9395_cov_19.399957_7_plen_122_part_00